MSFDKYLMFFCHGVSLIQILRNNILHSISMHAYVVIVFLVALLIIYLYRSVFFSLLNAYCINLDTLFDKPNEIVGTVHNLMERLT